MGSGPESGGGILGKAGLSDKIKADLADGNDSVGPSRGKPAPTIRQGQGQVMVMVVGAGLARDGMYDISESETKCFSWAELGTYPTRLPEGSG
ncbi:hypothetical protein PRtIB026_A15190 [Pseudomonas sp. RtIB026]|nr:hypothetical protein PRtIB026_A15190 [Pseudomonas sp. RtIB026]